MPSHATAQFNSAIRRQQLAGKDVTASDHIVGEGDDREQQLPFIHPIDNPASPAEFPATREQYAPPVSRFAPLTPSQREAYDDESTARHAPTGQMTTAVTPTGDGALPAEQRTVGDGEDDGEDDGDSARRSSADDPADALPLLAGGTPENADKEE